MEHKLVGDVGKGEEANEQVEVVVVDRSSGERRVVSLEGGDSLDEVYRKVGEVFSKREEMFVLRYNGELLGRKKGEEEEEEKKRGKEGEAEDVTAVDKEKCVCDTEVESGKELQLEPSRKGEAVIQLMQRGVEASKEVLNAAVQAGDLDLTALCLKAGVKACLGNVRLAFNSGSEDVLLELLENGHISIKSFRELMNLG